MAEHRLMTDAQFAEMVERRNKRFDRIDFLSEALLQKQNGLKSSFRGGMNSCQETLQQPFRSNHISHVAESSKKFKQSMAELSREIKQSSTRILELLQEEIDATELNDAVQISEAILPLPTQLDNEKSNFRNDFNSKMVDSPDLTNSIIGFTESLNSNKLDVEHCVHFDFAPKSYNLPFTEHVDSTAVIDKDVVVHRLSPQRETTLDVLPRSETLLSDPPDLVPVPPPLAPPWLHHSVYPKLLDSPTPSKVKNLPHHFQFAQEILIGTQSHISPKFNNKIDPRVITMLREDSDRDRRIVVGVFVCSIHGFSVNSKLQVGRIVGSAACPSDAFNNIVSSWEAHHLLVKMPLPTNLYCDTLTSFLIGFAGMHLVTQVNLQQYSLLVGPCFTKSLTSKLKRILIIGSVSTSLIIIKGYESDCAIENTDCVLCLNANQDSFNNALGLDKKLQTRFFTYASMVFIVYETLSSDGVMYVLHTLQVELANVKTTMERKGEALENLKKCLEFEEMKFVLANYEILVRQQHFYGSIALYVAAVHVLGVDVVNSQLIDIMESAVELVYLGATKDGGVVQEMEISPLAFRAQNSLIAAFIFKQVNKLSSLKLFADFFYVFGGFVLLEFLELLDPPQSLVWNVRSKLQAGITHGLAYLYCGWVTLVFEPDVEPFFIIHFVLVLHLGERTTGSNIPKLRGLTYLVGILQLAITICRVINDHELYSYVVLKRHVQESVLIYFENFDGNPLDVVTLLSGCFVHQRSSQFNQWDPGGCSLIHILVFGGLL